MVFIDFKYIFFHYLQENLDIFSIYLLFAIYLTHPWFVCICEMLLVICGALLPGVKLDREKIPRDASFG